jgi:acyl carrier protein
VPDQPAVAQQELSPEEATALILELVFELAPRQDVTARGLTLLLVDDLEYTSLALLELAFTLEDEFALEPITEETARQIVSVGHVVDHVLTELSRRTATATGS